MSAARAVHGIATELRQSPPETRPLFQAIRGLERKVAGMRWPAASVAPAAPVYRDLNRAAPAPVQARSTPTPVSPTTAAAGSMPAHRPPAAGPAHALPASADREAKPDPHGWHFRGWVFGYAIMEIVLLVASFGTVTGAKWAGKAAKLAKAITSLPRVQKTIKAVKSIKVPPKLQQGLNKVFKGGDKVDEAAKGADNAEDAGKAIAKLDFSQLDIPGAMRHVKFRDHSVPRSRGIGGCHDLSEWNKIRQVEEAAWGNPVGKTLDEVPEVIVHGKNPHPSVPGVYQIEYSIPAVDGKLAHEVIKTTIGNSTGALKKIRDPKTVYDPSVWPDARLEKSLKEALQDAADKNDGTLPREWSGVTSEGVTIRGYLNNGKISSFFFE